MGIAYFTKNFTKKSYGAMVETFATIQWRILNDFQNWNLMLIFAGH